MPIVKPKLEVLIDLSQPVNELVDTIIMVANSQPGKQLEIMQQVELRLGEQIQAIENEISKASIVQSEGNIVGTLPIKANAT